MVIDLQSALTVGMHFGEVWMLQMINNFDLRHVKKKKKMHFLFFFSPSALLQSDEQPAIPQPHHDPTGVLPDIHSRCILCGQRQTFAPLQPPLRGLGVPQRRENLQSKSCTRCSYVFSLLVAFCEMHPFLAVFQKLSLKVQHILQIWAAGQGVVSLHCFQNVIPVEAYTREACMVEAIGEYISSRVIKRTEPSKSKANK